MTKRQKYQEDRQYNDQKTKKSGRQTIQWSKDKHNRRTDNTMTKRKKYQEDRQYNDQKTKISGGQTMQWLKDKNNRTRQYND